MLRGLRWLGGSLLLLGCTAVNPLYADSSGETTGASTSTPPKPEGSSSTGSAGSATSVDSTGHDGSTDTEVDPDATGQTSSTTGPDPETCSTYVQDCPKDDEKCMPWANDGGATWNALSCFPLDPDPGLPGDVCTVEDSAVSGIDDCNETSMCWDVDHESRQGTCVAFCRGSEASPVCDSPDTRCVQIGGVVAVCLDRCDPLLQDCSNGEACVPDNDGFACVPTESNMLEPGDPCIRWNECGAGSVCMDTDAIVGCGAISCCTAFCSVSDGTDCLQEAVCVPWYPEGEAPAGLEDVGFCGSPT